MKSSIRPVTRWATRPPPAHVVLGQDDVVGTDAFKDLAVLAAGGPRPDVGQGRVDEVGGGQDAGFQVGADADHYAGELPDAELCQRGGVGAVRGGVGQRVADLLDEEARLPCFMSLPSVVMTASGAPGRRPAEAPRT